MEIPALQACCTLVPAAFFDPDSASMTLSEVTGTDFKNATNCRVKYADVPEWDAVLIYAEKNISGGSQLPEMFYILRDLSACRDYNKIVCSYDGVYLHMAIAQGRSLLLGNSYAATDFTTAEYYIFLALKSLQLNPEVSVIRFRSKLNSEQELSLYNYFKDVEQL